MADSVNDKSWSTFITTPAAIEQAASITFFTNLPETIREGLRTQRFDPTDTSLNEYYPSQF